ncbi:hypothetical protein C8F01DRAFT_1247928 [Mycena amicta]|nr:hypothetical protein C8F01DRAFT_1247928 [Mycena amicta]
MEGDVYHGVGMAHSRAPVVEFLSLATSIPHLRGTQLPNSTRPIVRVRDDMGLNMTTTSTGSRTILATRIRRRRVGRQLDDTASALGMHNGYSESHSQSSSTYSSLSPAAVPPEWPLCLFEFELAKTDLVILPAQVKLDSAKANATDNPNDIRVGNLVVVEVDWAR